MLGFNFLCISTLRKSEFDVDFVSWSEQMHMLFIIITSGLDESMFRLLDVRVKCFLFSTMIRLSLGIRLQNQDGDSTTKTSPEIHINSGISSLLSHAKRTALHLGGKGNQTVKQRWGSS